MKNAIKAKNSVTINFNKDLYSLKAVKSAGKAYKDLVDFCVVDGKKYIKVTIKNISPEEAPIIEPEFCNYVLGLMVDSSVK